MTTLTANVKNTEIQDFKEFIKTLKQPKKIICWYTISADMAGNIIKLKTDDKKIIEYAKKAGLI